MYKVAFIEAGHGKSNGAFDPGTVYEGLTERSVTVSVAKKVAEYLGEKAILIGATQDLSLEEKTILINKKCKELGLDHSTSLLISIHVDYFKAPSGVCSYHYADNKESNHLAQTIIQSISEATQIPIRWNKPDTSSRFGRLGIIRDTTPLACLIELGSIKEDANLLRETTKLASAIADGIRLDAGWPKEVTPGKNQNIEDVMTLISSAWQDFDKIDMLTAEGKQKLNKANDILRSIS